MPRPASWAQRSSASALVPLMSDLKPPSQSRAGGPPGRTRTAMRRSALPVPTSRNFRQGSVISAWPGGNICRIGRGHYSVSPSMQACRDGNKAEPVGAGLMSEEHRDRHVSPRTLAGATVLQIVPALCEEPVARTAVDVAHALLQSGARALVAAEGGPLADDLRAGGGEWVPLVNARANPFKLRTCGHMLERLIASERVDIVHAQSIGGAWGANMAASQIAVW